MSLRSRQTYPCFLVVVHLLLECGGPVEEGYPRRCGQQSVDLMANALQVLVADLEPTALVVEVPAGAEGDLGREPLVGLHLGTDRIAALFVPVYLDVSVRQGGQALAGLDAVGHAQYVAEFEGVEQLAVACSPSRTRSRARAWALSGLPPGTRGRGSRGPCCAFRPWPV